jgi:predicted phage tail protein
MKPAWDKLMTEYKGNKDVLIGDCDCTADGKSLCEEVGVQGYPTIKYGDPSALEDYQGGRDFDSLKKHAETKLKPSCSPTNLHLCDDAKKAEIEKLQAMSAADLEKEISGKEAEISEAEKTFKSEVEKLQAAYKKLQQTKEDTIKNVKDSGLGLMKAVKAANKKK